MSVTIVNVCTISDYAPYLEPDGSDRVLQVTVARRAEDDRFATCLMKQIGSNHNSLQWTDLAWLDLPLRWQTGCDRALAPSPLSASERDTLCRVLAQLPGADLVFSPLAIGGHVDHRLLRSAAEQTFDASALVFYEDLPYACQQSRLNSDEHLFDAWLPSGGLPAEWKLSYASCYDSQISQELAIAVAAYAASRGGRERVLGTATSIARLKTIMYAKEASV